MSWHSVDSGSWFHDPEEQARRHLSPVLYEAFITMRRRSILVRGGANLALNGGRDYDQYSPECICGKCPSFAVWSRWFDIITPDSIRGLPY